MHPQRFEVEKSYKWIQLFAAYLVPLITGLASWVVRESIISKFSSSTLGHSNARPFFGFTAILSDGKLVSPPSSTSLKYKKNVKIRGPQVKPVWALYIFKKIQINNMYIYELKLYLMDEKIVYVSTIISVIYYIYFIRV